MHVMVGFLAAIAVIVVLMRMDLKKFLGYPVMMDIVVTLILSYLLYGTFGGMVSAIIAGLFFSLFLTLLRRLYGYKRLTLKRFRFVWQEYPAVWSEGIIHALKNGLSHTSQAIKEMPSHAKYSLR